MLRCILPRLSATETNFYAQHMEDNLSRARTSLVLGSPRTDSAASTPSPSVARLSTSLFLSPSGPSSPASGHHRIGSDNSLRIGIPIKVYPQRSSSVLGVSTAPRPQTLNVSKSADQLNGQYNRQRTSYIMRDPSLEPLGEDDVSVIIPKRFSANTSPTYGLPADRGLSRSASTSQMNNIRDQVNDLKGKISSLREQARADSMKRRSLQSLRTPSPFTHAQIQHFYAGTEGGSKTASQNSSSPRAAEMTSDDRPRKGSFDRPHRADGVGDSPVEVPPILEEALDEDADRFEVGSPGLVVPHGAEVDMDGEDDNEDMLTENGDVEEELEGDDVESEYEEAIEEEYDMVSDSGDSIYHESVQNQLSHEDREDAFDYEHFFLHSAMGTISQRLARRGSDASTISESSVETTRGPTAGDTYTDQEEPPVLPRRGSETSISTIETFTTAEEGMSSRHGSLEINRTEEEEQEEEDHVDPEPFPVLYATANTVDRPDTPPTAKRATFAGAGSCPTEACQTEQKSSGPEGLHSALRRPMSSSAAMRPHATSVSSIASSTGTTRSFPLVNRHSKSSSGGIPTPDGGSSAPSTHATSSLGIRSDSAAKGHKTSISLHSMSSAASLIEESGTTAVMETLPRDDQFLVERLVASLGRCVLGLTESGRASTEARMYRRRIDAARKILEGFEPA